MDASENLDVLATDVLPFAGEEDLHGVILDYPLLKRAGLSDGMADWKNRRPLAGRTLVAPDGRQGVLVAVRLRDRSRPSNLTVVTAHTRNGAAYNYLQHVPAKPHGQPCTLDDTDSTRTWDP